MDKVKIEAELTKATLKKDVGLAWHRTYFAQKKRDLYREMDTLYQNFVKTAKLKFETGETSKVAYLSALSNYRNYTIDKQQAESEFLENLHYLNQFLGLKDIDNVRLKMLENQLENDKSEAKDIKSGLLLKAYKTETELAKAKWQMAKKEWLPKFNFGYKQQRIDGVSGFTAWEAGISLPLNIFSVRSKIKSAEMAYQTAEAEMAQQTAFTEAVYKQMLVKKATMKRILAYYENEALPLADEQIKMVYTAYALGDIDYMQFIQNIQSALKTKMDYLHKDVDYQQIIINLNYLTQH